MTSKKLIERGGGEVEERKKKQEEDEKKIMENLLAKNIKSIHDIEVEVLEGANEKGHLFAGIHKDEIVKQLHSQARIELDLAFVDLEHPLKTVGEYVVSIKAGGKSANLKVTVKAL